MAEHIPVAVPVAGTAAPVSDPALQGIQQMLPPSWDDIKRQRVAQVLRHMDIQPSIMQRVARSLGGFANAFVLDNSGSMRTPVEKSSFAQPGVRMTRHQEMIAFMGIVLPLFVAEAPEGADIWLLNHPHSGAPGPFRIQNVQTIEQLLQHLGPPNGSTPLVPTLMQVFAAHQHHMAGEGLHVIIVTDGEPDEYGGQPGRLALYNLLARNSPYRPNPRKCTISILAASDNHSDVEFLDMLDTRCPCVDVTDDYAAERKQVAKMRTFPRPLSVADWAYKATVYDAQMDAADERRGCCTIL
jgi:hypothetical protein